MAKYFCSDFHFGHELMVRKERIDCKTVEEHDDKILYFLNLLSENDELYFLGDFGYLSDEKATRFKNLKCKKHMVMGNHDHYPMEHYKNRYGFETVYPGPFYLTKRILLSHYPIKVEDSIINVHGHLHNSTLSLKNYVNVSIYCIKYRPLHEKNLAKLLGKLPRYEAEEFMSEWFAPYYRYFYNPGDLVLNEDGSLDIEESKKLMKKLRNERD